MSITCPLANMSRFLQKLEHCSGENAEILHNQFKPAKHKTKDFGIDPESREVVTDATSSFTGHLCGRQPSYFDQFAQQTM